jgi:calcium-dependent protein kinase
VALRTCLAYVIDNTYSNPYGSLAPSLTLPQELCSGGDLYSRDPYTEEEAVRITSSILSAVAYMHYKGIIHRDLKYENILFVDNNPRAEIKLIDFGLSKRFTHEDLTEGVGTM